MKKIIEDKTIKAFLFDLDGVILDTESQYTIFWNSVGEKILGQADFALKIKGKSLSSIFKNYFSVCDILPDFRRTYSQNDLWKKISEDLVLFESNMEMPYINGAYSFFTSAKNCGKKIAIVTSSSSKKMETVKKNHPEIYNVFDRVFTADEYRHGKPAPDCYLLAADYFSLLPSECVVFEDSLTGLQAGKAAKMFVVGLATTNKKEIIAKYADCIINDFSDMDGFVF